MFGIDYETWYEVCNMYCNLKEQVKKSYLQWFPFSRLSNEDINTLLSKNFFEKYIKTGSFIFFPNVLFRSKNYIEKTDGSMRNSTLLSPILFLILQCIGKVVSENFNCQRPSQISAYYSGNYILSNPSYKSEYNDFYKCVNEFIFESDYFIKTDISDFYSNININKLIDQIDKKSNQEGVVFTQTQLLLFKEILYYCGNGKFPLVENSVASSYLATIVYLDEVDKRLFDYIKTNITIFDDFTIVRYVDDMYILISSKHPESEIHKAYNQIKNEYSSILHEYGLSLNTKKCCVKPSAEICEELKHSTYDEFYTGINTQIEELYNGSLEKFLDKLYHEISTDYLDTAKYVRIMDDCFKREDIEYSPTEVLNYYIYRKEKIFQTEHIIKKIKQLIDYDISFISLDAKRLSTMVSNTKNGLAIKALLNQLFDRNRKNKWNSYDTVIAVSYLIQRQFKHVDLLRLLSENEPALHDYYKYFCSENTNFLELFKNKRANSYAKIIQNLHDWKASFLYFMYLMENDKKNILSCYAFFKNYFDRLTADLAYLTNVDKKPYYNKYFKEKTFIDFYSEVENAKDIIKEAHKYRNSNPVDHGSAELIDNNNRTEDLVKSIQALNMVLDEYKRIHNLT